MAMRHVVRAVSAGCCACMMVSADSGAQARSTRVKTAIVAADTDLREALTQRQRPVWDRADSIPFVISASGGISLGAYQAGVTWALGRFMRHLADGASPLDSIAVGRPVLAAATGASAGNINAVLSAIEWCTPTAAGAEESLFWKVWVSVGWPELFPDHRLAQAPSGDSAARMLPVQASARPARQPDAGLFDRSFFNDRLFPLVRERLDGATRPECNGLPIGVTATRIEPISFPVTQQLTALTQRYAAVFRLEKNANGTGLVFAQPDTLLRDRFLGAVLALDVGESRYIPSDDVFTLIEASSAFPVAFSPRLLRYYEADSLAADGSCPPDPAKRRRCAPSLRAYFTDGGVFDNNPLQLALNLYQRTRPGVSISPEGYNEELTQFAIMPPRALYVGTDQFRNDSLRRLRALSSDSAAIGGLDAVSRLLRGAVPAARQYEMQTLARTLARDRVMPSQYIRVTDRHLPLFGEHLGAFGAFLGRPMREWDFFAGMYDGLHFAASDIICAGDGETMKRVEVGDAKRFADRDACTRHYVSRLIMGQVFPVGGVASHVLVKMYAHEHKSPLPSFASPVRLAPQDSQRVFVSRVLTEAQISQISRGKQECPTKDWAKAVLCDGNLDVLIGDIGRDTALMRIITSWSGAQQCQVRLGPIDPPCLADPTFLHFVRNPASEFKHRAGHITNRLWTVEKRIRKANFERRDAGRAVNKDTVVATIPEFSSWVEFAELVLRSYDWPARRGWDLDPSSIPPETADKKKRLGSSLLPYEVSVGWRVGGYEVGWMPIRHLSEKWALQFPLSFAGVNQARERGDVPPRRLIQPGIGILKKRGGMVFPAYGIAVRPIVALVHVREGDVRQPREQQNMVSVEATALALAGKLRLSLYSLPPGMSGSKRVAGRIGIADLPGIVYWIWK